MGGRVFSTTTPCHHLAVVRQLQTAIVRHPEGSFTCVTNRIASAWQKAEEAQA